MKRNKGFTIVELMVIIGLISILLTYTMVSIKKNREKARDNVRAADLKTIRLALEEYKNACFEYPDKIYKGSGSAADNGRCPAGIDFDTFLLYPPVDPGDGSQYMYVGLSNNLGGKCYDYHIAAQLEYDADGEPAFGENALLRDDHDYADDEGTYRVRCASGTLIDAAPDDTDGLYDLKSNNSK